MKVFVYEYCTCQPLTSDKWTEALRDEGGAIVAAVMIDLCEVRGVKPTELVADDVAPACWPYRNTSLDREKRVFQELAHESDYTLVIAPETDGLLEERCRWVLEA